MMTLSSLDAERGLLCSLLHQEQGSSVYSICLSRGIGPDHFSSPGHVLIFNSIRELHTKEEPVDLITVTSRLRDAGWLEDCGGAHYLTDLFTGKGIPSNAKAYCSDLDEKKRMRAAFNLSSRIRGELEAPIPDFQEWVSGVVDEAAGLKVTLGSLKTPTRVAREFLDFYERVETCAPMVSCGIDPIDLQAGPFMRGDSVVVSGVTGGGKSALVNSFIDRSIDLKQTVAVFTLEMSSIQYVERIVAARGGVNMHGVRQLLFKKQRVNNEIYDKINKAVHEYAKSNIYIVDNVSTIAELEAKCIQIHARKPLDLIVLDYAQLLSAPGDNREREVANVSLGMKRLAMKLQSVSFILSQLNDDGKLRESRAIGHDANVVLNIERDDKSTWVRVAKGRSCPAGTKISLKWIPEFTKFENFTPII